MRLFSPIIFTAGLLCLIVTSGQADDTASPKSEPLLTRTYAIKHEVFVKNLKYVLSPKEGESNQDTLLRFLKNNGIEIKTPAAVLLNEQSNRVLVRATDSSQSKIETLLLKLNRAE